jgi:exosortase D (VPLPA-CTERM-specific)
MSETTESNNQNLIKAIAVAAAIGFLYTSVLSKLGRDWWMDENYSHGLLVPFVIALIIWIDWDTFVSAERKPSPLIGGAAVGAAMLMLLAGTLGAELFTARISFVLMLAGVVLYFFGAKLLKLLAVPFALLLLTIPIPQIIFNRIAFPLQIWASQMAVWGIRLFEVPVVRKGNVIEILPQGATQTISLEVVEACSGIRSLMTLVTLALILAYFTRLGRGGFANMSRGDLIRTVLLMISAVPIAVITNAARVTATGLFTYTHGRQATEGFWHDSSGWLVYVVALAMLIGVNFLLRSFQRRGAETQSEPSAIRTPHSALRTPSAWPLVVAIVIGGIAVNWFATRSETVPDRQPLTQLSTKLGDWQQKGGDIRFDESVESVLKTTDYTMREYTLPDGRIANLYVGYYASQRTGATYHSPLNCLPGAGWVMKDPQRIDITTADGRTFTANRYIIENGIYREVMIYWYQGRGHTEASEYRDKVNTVLDSITRSRSDGAIVRVMTSVGSDEPAALQAATDLAAQLAAELTPFVPE